MKRFYKIFRTFILIVLGLIVLLPTLLYVGLELDFVQNPARRRAERELSQLLGVDVAIGQVSVAPFNRVTMRGVSLTNNQDTIAHIARLGAGVDLYKLMLNRRLEFGYAEIVGLSLRVWRDSSDAPLNIQPIIDALAPKDPNAPPTQYDLAIRTIVLRKSSLSYDVRSAEATPGRFDPNHIAVGNLRADVRIPRLSNDNITIDLNRLAFDEVSGFSMQSLSARAIIAGNELTLFDPSLSLPATSLQLSTVTLPIKGEGAFVDRIRNHEFNVALLPGSHITPSDFSAFMPALSEFDRQIDVDFDIEGTADNMLVNSLSVENEDLSILLSKTSVINLTAEKPQIIVPKISVNTDSRYIADILRTFGRPVAPALAALLANVGELSLTGEGEFTPRNSAAFDGFLSTDCGVIDVDARGEFSSVPDLRASLQCKNLALAQLLKGVTQTSSLPSSLSFTADIDATLPPHRNPTGEAHIDIPRIEYRGLTLTDITADAQLTRDNMLTATVTGSDPRYLTANLLAKADLTGYNTEIDADIQQLALSLLSDKYPEGSLAAQAAATLHGRNIDTADFSINVDRLSIIKEPGKNFTTTDMALTQRCDSLSREMHFRSDIADADITGQFTIKSLVDGCRDIVADIVPALFDTAPRTSTHLSTADANSLNANVRIKTTETLADLVKLPVTVIHPVEIHALLDSHSGLMTLDLDAPFLMQGNKLIEKTELHAAINGDNNSGDITFATLFPAKKQRVKLDLATALGLNRANTNLTWGVPGNNAYHGNLNLASSFERTGDNSLLTTVDIADGRAVFNDTTWTFRPSSVAIRPRHISVDHFVVDGFNQRLSIEGLATPSPDDSLHMVLDDIDLDYVFETLGISNAMFGGRASGNFYGSALLSPAPRLFTDDLDVRGIKYNHCLMGDAKIRSGWDIDRKAVTIKADITGDHSNVSRIDGFIKPMTEELDFRFDADDVPVGFLLPFMSAFTSAVDGRASGNAHLYGTFKYIDMTGDLFANDFRMKVDFTNCWYGTTDSIKMRPGYINIPGVTLHDDFGNTARMDGWVKHTYFKAPEFNFNVTNARNLLVYDIRKAPDLRWYGTVFGNGGANISGQPGIVKIGVNMSTAPKSAFTFVLSDAQQAYDYNFITFRDKNALGQPVDPDTIMSETLRRLQARINANNPPDIPSDYNMDINVAVNDNTRMTLIMDPIGGDNIQAFGNGNLRLTYGSSDERLNMYGDYTLSQGSYKFTLQDIIIKDFRIKPGSVISFNGDPYAANLDVKAAYSLNANLSELDESFSQDRELARPNVPVNAMLFVTGDIRQPEVNFDLEFPTLTSDTYRKVRSIISTDDMMNRQIIYLLALNRFYTPDYMADANRGNEFVSVASSAISSQLSNILGQISDKWSIAPNFRSDRGDFSDMEFDVALSSRLLNNRLLLNGNLGYRDKTMNNNSFIGDFDLEYLLNRSGSLRLKAYNRYNDRNFYVKSALTTQGVGLIYRRDFDNMFRFLRRRNKESNKEKQP